MFIPLWIMLLLIVFVAPIRNFVIGGALIFGLLSFGLTLLAITVALFGSFIVIAFH